MIGRFVLLARRDGLLDCDSAAHGIDSGGKLNQGAVARELDESAAVAVDRWIDHLPPQGFQPRQGAFFVLFHQARVANNVCDQNSRQPALHSVISHQTVPVGALANE